MAETCIRKAWSGDSRLAGDARSSGCHRGGWLVVVVTDDGGASPSGGVEIEVLNAGEVPPAPDGYGAPPHTGAAPRMVRTQGEPPSLLRTNVTPFVTRTSAMP